VLQDALRLVAFAEGHPQDALILDAVWLAVMIPAGLVSIVLPTAGGVVAVSGWLAGSAVATVCGLIRVSVFPRMLRWLRWLRANSRVNVPYLGEALLGVGASQLSVVALAFFSIAMTAGWRGATTLLGPFTVVLLGTNAFALPQMVRRVGYGGPARALLPAAVTSIVLLVGCASWASVVLLLPREVGMTVLGATWPHAYDLVVPVTVWMCGTCVATGAQLGLRAGMFVWWGLGLRIGYAVVLAGLLLVSMQITSPSLASWSFGVAGWTLAIGAWAVFFLRTRTRTKS
jgi:hypothetical protein